MGKDRIAIIDMGTNTFHLLIAEKDSSKGTVLLNEKVAVKIGQGGISKNKISPDAFERALTTLTRFKKTIDEHHVKKVIAIATSAVRNAANGSVLVKEVKEQLGIEIEVISGDREAELIYEGVRYGVSLGKETSVIMDIGGGSVEFIICNEETIFWKQSFEIGGQRLMDRFHRQDPISKEEVLDLKKYLAEKLAPLLEACNLHQPKILVGSSGTFDTLSDIDVRRKGIDFSIETGIEYDLSLQDFEEISSDIIHKTRGERLKIDGMATMRVDMIVVACILIQFVNEKLGIRQIKACAYALKEGVLSRTFKL